MRFVLFSIIALTLFSCSAQTPEFNKEEAFSFLEFQCDLGPRAPGTEEIQLCRNYITAKLEEYNSIVTEQKFDVEVRDINYQGVNIIGSYNPMLSRRILLAAHYDTRLWADKDANPENHSKPIIGANDAASGVAVLLEIAAVISRQAPEQYGVDLVFFDLEDLGDYNNTDSWCKGSQFFADNFSGTKPEKAIIVDMIGDADLEITIEYQSYRNSPALVNQVWDIAKNYGFSEFKHKITAAITDDHIPLINIGINAIDIIDFDYPYWHTAEDTRDKCSPHSLYVVGQTLLELIYTAE
jgi:glutaminyl-peptide cyclotransferase